MKRRNVAGIVLGVLGIEMFLLALIAAMPPLSLWWLGMGFSGCSFLFLISGGFIFNSPEFPKFSDILFVAAALSALILGVILVTKAPDLTIRVTVGIIAVLLIMLIEGIIYTRSLRRKKSGYIRHPFVLKDGKEN